MAAPTVKITINGVVPPNDRSAIYVGTSAYALVQVTYPSGWDMRTVDGIYFALTAYDGVGIEHQPITWYWTSKNKSSLGVNLDTYMQYADAGWMFYINAAVITTFPKENGKDKIFSGSTTSPRTYGMRTSSDVHAGYFYLDYDTTPGTIVNNFLIYPNTTESLYLGNPRKVIFKSVGSSSISDIKISYDVGNTHREYLWSTNKKMFELRSKNGNTWVNFNPATTVIPDVFYGVFSMPSENNNSLISNIIVDTVCARSTESQEDASFKYRSYDKIAVYKGDTITKTQADRLKEASDAIFQSYKKTCNEFSLPYYSGYTIYNPDNPIVKASPFGDLIDYWVDFYNGLKSIFPETFTTNVNMYFPQAGKLIEANDNTPSLMENGNFFNNTLWVLKNLL